MLYDLLLDEIRVHPGVESATASWQTPLQTGMSDWPARAERDGAEWLGADPNMVTLDYFQTLGIELVEGRLFDASDLARPEGSVIVSETAARRLFPDGSAVGRRVNVDFDAPVWREIVGVARDVRIRGLGSDPNPQTYFTMSDLPFGPIRTMRVTLRTSVSSAEIASALAGIMRRVDAEIPVGPVTSMEHQVAISMARERFLATVLGAFAGTALLLGMLGVYGLLAYDVTRGRREIGLRIALGATPGAMLGRVVGGALVVGFVGVAIGTAGALATGRLLDAFLYGVSSTDLVTLTGVGTVTLLAAATAGFIPGRRAAGTNPVTALKEG
jgi:ABC-type antimicrobial peptide transport system permease subunit